ncbi:TPA: glycosyltransferase family 25 protein [Neisseria meningitidis]
MQNHVISLASAAERRAHITDTFGVRGIPFQFFDALMPSEELNRMMAELVPGLAKQHLLSEVEKACFMSHAVLWKQALDEGLPYVAVFEDDVLLGKDAEKFLAEDTWLEERFDKDSAFIVRLETMFAKVIVRPDKVLNYENRSFPLLESEHWGTAGYIISREAMRFFLDRFAALPPEGLHPVDLMMFSDFFDREGVPVCQLNPALCVQELHYAKFHDQNSALGSLIEHDRLLNRKQQWRDSPANTFKRRLIRALTKISREREKRRQRREQFIVPFQ